MTHSINSITNNCFLTFPEDVVPLILRKLDILSLIRFERAHSKHYSLTQYIWLDKRKENKLLFDWSFLEKHPQIDKWSYVLSDLLIKYVCVDRKTLKSKAEENIRIAKAKKIQDRLSALIERFPLWGCYMEEDLQEMQVSSHFISKISRIGGQLINYFSPSKHKEELAKKAAEAEWGGDLLLQGLFEAKQLSPTSSDQDIQRVLDYFKKAIARKATWACSLAFHVLNEIDIKWYIPLINAAAEREDYTGVEIIQRNWPTEVQQLTFNKGAAFAEFKVQFGYGFLIKKCWIEADSDYQEALEIYGESVPFHVLEDVAYVKVQLGEFEKADALYTRLLDKYKNQTKQNVLQNAAYVKFKLGQFKEGDALYTQSLEKDDDRVVIGLWGKAVNERYESQDPRPSHQPSRTILLRAVTCQLDPSQLKEIDSLYTQELEKEEDQVSVNRLNNAAYIKLYLKEHEAADSLFARLLEKAGDQAPVQAFANAIVTKLALDKYEEADALCRRVLEIHEEKTLPVELLNNMAFTKKSLKQFETADKLYTYVLEKYGDKAFPETVSTAMVVKYFLGQWETAYCLAMRVIEMIGEKKTPAYVFQVAGLAKERLNQLEEADALYTQALARSGDQPDATLLESAERVKLKLNQKENANDTSS